MIFRFCGGIGLLLLALQMFGVAGIPNNIIAIFLALGGVGLLAGL